MTSVATIGFPRGTGGGALSVKHTLSAPGAAKGLELEMFRWKMKLERKYYMHSNVTPFNYFLQMKD